MNETPAGAAIAVTDLVKRFGAVTAVDGLSFEVPRGSIFGLLGRNGAGKTTTLECCVGLQRPTSGSIRVAGLDPTRSSDLAKLRRRFGVQLQTTSLPEKATAGEILELYASFYGMRADLEATAKRVGLTGALKRYVGAMSGGEKQRLALALALQHDPEVIFLDEPTAGMDAFGRRILWAEVEQLRAAGKTVVLTTHYIEEAERLCDEICVVQAGRIVARDTPAALVAKYGGAASSGKHHVPGARVRARRLTRGCRHLGRIRRRLYARHLARAGRGARAHRDACQRQRRADRSARFAPAGFGRCVPRHHRRAYRRICGGRSGVNTLRVLLIQTRLDFVWYFLRDGEMIFWSLAIPVFFLVVFSFALGAGSTKQTSMFLVPGIIGAQVLSSGFWGVGAMLATFREKNLLRRIYLTPVPRWTFFASLILYRMTLLATQAILLSAVGVFMFHARITGNPLEVIAILVLGAATFVALGSVIGALVKSTESANNIASVLTVPLAFVSDAYIPIDRFPDVVSIPLRFLPSTQFIDAFRGIAMYGKTLEDYSGWVLALVLWTVAGTLVSARFFRWV